MRQLIFKPKTLQQLIDYRESPEGKRESQIRESEYRRGYWHGVHQTVEYLKNGSELRQIDDWLWGELKRWRYSYCDKLILPPQFIPWNRLRLAILDSYLRTCAYCGKRATHVDHIIPVSKGGGYNLDNLVAACARCNLIKNARTPSEAGMRFNYYPKFNIEIVEEGYRCLTVRLRDI